MWKSSKNFCLTVELKPLSHNSHKFSTSEFRLDLVERLCQNNMVFYELLNFGFGIDDVQDHSFSLKSND